MFLVMSGSCLCPIHINQVLSPEWRCSWSSTDRQCSNYICVIWRTSLKIGILIFWQCFLPARPKQLLREKGWLTDAAHNSWCHMKHAQHAAHNPKFEKMGLFRRWWYGIGHGGPVDSPHKGQCWRKCFHVMTSHLLDQNSSPSGHWVDI